MGFFLKVQLCLMARFTIDFLYQTLKPDFLNLTFLWEIGFLLRYPTMELSNVGIENEGKNFNYGNVINSDFSY